MFEIISENSQTVKTGSVTKTEYINNIDDLINTLPTKIIDENKIIDFCGNRINVIGDHKTETFWIYKTD